MSEPHASPERYLATLSPHAPQAAGAKVGLVGVPYDGTVTHRPGAAKGPAGIRAASDSIETYCPKLDLDLADTAPVDLGDLETLGGRPGHEAIRAWADQLVPLIGARSILALGGDHLVAYPFLMRALERWPNLQILHIDAHADLRPSWEGEPFNHATVLGRVLDGMGPDARLHQWGVRSGSRDEFRLVAEEPRICPLAPTLDAATTLVRDLARHGAPLYVTLDIDGLDPADAPGTGTPEPGGLPFGMVEDALCEVVGAKAKLVGADLVELAPVLDPSGRTAVVGARLARTLLLALQASNG